LVIQIGGETLSGDGSDWPMGPKVVIPNYIGNTRQRDVIGNKLDSASGLPTASVIAHLRYIEVMLGASATAALVMHTEMTEFSYVNASIVYAVSVLNRSTENPVPAVNLTAGTINVIRIRGGVETTISAGVTLLKKDGILYYIIDLTSVSWAEDDAVKVVENTKSTATIGVTTYDIVQIPQTCLLTDLGDISTQIDNIETIVTETNGYLEPAGQIYVMLQNIQSTCDSIEGKIDVIDPIVDQILLDTTELLKGMLGKENPVMIWASPNIPSTALGFAVNDLLSSFPAGAAISVKPTCTIDRWRKGVDVTWLNVTSSATVDSNGRIYYPYHFPASAWAVGDLARITFDNATITFNGKAFQLPAQEMYCVVGLNDILQDLANGGRLDLILDDIVSDLATVILALNTIESKIDSVQADVITINGKVDVIDGNVDTIYSWVDDLRVWWVDGGRLDLILDAILEDTNELQLDWEDGGRLDLILDDTNDTVHDIEDALDDEFVKTEGIFEKVNGELQLKEYNFLFAPEDSGDIILLKMEEHRMKNPLLVRLNVENMAEGDSITLTESHQLEAYGSYKQVEKEQYDDLVGGLEDGSEVITWHLTPNRWGIKLVFNQISSATGYDPAVNFETQAIFKEGE